MTQVTYKNCKGKTYFLCRGTTRSGRPRYFFTAEPRDEPVDQIPEGYEIRESVNGLVSLAKIRPQVILPEELAAVEAAVARHPKAKNYRVDAKGDKIVIYERVGPNVEDLGFLLDLAGTSAARRLAALEERFSQTARFTGEMRFVLVDEEKRIFHAERWNYSGSIDNWAELHGPGSQGPIEKLASRLVPKLGTDAFFDLY